MKVRKGSKRKIFGSKLTELFGFVSMSEYVTVTVVDNSLTGHPKYYGCVVEGEGFDNDEVYLFEKDEFESL